MMKLTVLLSASVAVAQAGTNQTLAPTEQFTRPTGVSTPFPTFGDIPPPTPFPTPVPTVSFAPTRGVGRASSTVERN